jgi:hypothetical protein
MKKIRKKEAEYRQHKKQQFLHWDEAPVHSRQLLKKQRNS